MTRVMKIKSASFWAYSKRIDIKKTGIGLLLAFLVCSNAVIFFTMEKKSSRIGYVNLPKVYEKFKMREEAAANLVKVQRQREQVLYSMEASLKGGTSGSGQKVTRQD